MPFVVLKNGDYNVYRRCLCELPKKADGADLGDCVIVLDEYGNLIKMNGS
jgi:hypothetical protein